ncbi:Protein kinase superfamily protein [Trifolium repens]|nr:Protein kinase superfamily protein [Trifolium repens]
MRLTKLHRDNDLHRLLFMPNGLPDGEGGSQVEKDDDDDDENKIGQGTYNSVYRARDLETNKIVALKKVKFTNIDPESVRFMARKIILLRRLDHPNVMKLEGMITSKLSGSLYLIFEYMEHDLTGLSTMPANKITQPQIGSDALPFRSAFRDVIFRQRWDSSIIKTTGVNRNNLEPEAESILVQFKVFCPNIISEAYL